MQHITIVFYGPHLHALSPILFDVPLLLLSGLMAMAGLTEALEYVVHEGMSAYRAPREQMVHVLSRANPSAREASRAQRLQR